MAASLCFPLLCLSFLLFSFVIAQDSSFTDAQPPKLSAPLVGDDGTLYTCYGKNLLAFNSNGTIKWTLPLGFSCREDVPPVPDGGGKLYLIAEDRILKVIPSSISTPESAVEIFFGPDSEFGGSGEIVGISVSIWNSAIFINLKRRGIFALTLRGQLLWTAGPVIHRFGFTQGCRENVTDCYFSSAPAIDQCEGVLFISTSEGQLYSMYTRNPNFRWIKDFSNIDKLFFITPGNNGHLYVTFPSLSLLMSLDVSTGDVIWQNNVGPLSSESSSPIVDSNGWVSIGSLDGYLYSISPTGVPTKLLKSTATDAVIEVTPFLDCSGFAAYVSQTIMEEKISNIIDKHTFISAMIPIGEVLTMLVPATGAVYWTETYNPGELLSKSDLRHFRPDENILLGFLASSGSGKFTPSYSTHQKLEWTCSHAKFEYANIYTSNEKKILLFLFFQFFLIIVLSMAVRFCFVFWRKKKLKEQDLGKFINRRHSLHLKRKDCSRIISELQQKVGQEASSSYALDQLGEIVRKKEAIERKLSTSYSLGRDKSPVRKDKSVLPLYDGKTKSYSFHSTKRESVTIFNTLSDTSTSEDNGSESEGTISTSSSSGVIEEENYQFVEDMNYAVKGKAPAIEGPSTSHATGFSMQVNPLFSESRSQGSGFEIRRADEFVDESMQGEISDKAIWLKRRRSVSPSFLQWHPTDVSKVDNVSFERKTGS